MTIRTQRRLYWLSAALLGAGVVAVWANGFLRPGPAADQTLSIEGHAVANPDRDRSDAQTPGHAPALNDFRGLWDKPLRRALYDPPPPPPPAAAPPPPLRLKLLGTIFEPGRSEAILMTSTGEVQMLRVGAVVDDATLQTIEDTQITVLYHDQQIILTPQP